MASVLTKRLIELERNQAAAQKQGIVVVDVNPGESWPEALYMAMLKVKGPAVYVRNDRGI